MSGHGHEAERAGVRQPRAIESAPGQRAASTVQPARVAVVGAGLMGTEIGLEYAIAGFAVTLVDRAADALARSVARAREVLEFLSGAGLVATDLEAALGRLGVSDDLARGVLGAGLVVEAVDEDFELKVRVLRQVALLNPTTTIATNTSALSVTELGASCQAEERIIGTHYMNPPTLMPLVEVVPGARTEAARTQRTLDTLRAMGKEAILVGDVAGFITNRLQLALLREAASLVDQGVATPETIDLVARLGFGRRWSLAGPFESMAAGGPATLGKVADEVFPHLSADTDSTVLRRIQLPASRDVAAAIARRNAGYARLLREDRGLPIPRSAHPDPA